MILDAHCYILLTYDALYDFTLIKAQLVADPLGSADQLPRIHFSNGYFDVYSFFIEGVMFLNYNQGVWIKQTN